MKHIIKRVGQNENIENMKKLPCKISSGNTTKQESKMSEFQKWHEGKTLLFQMNSTVE